jgi:hypothetical protein
MRKMEFSILRGLKVEHCTPFAAEPYRDKKIASPIAKRHGTPSIRAGSFRLIVN